MLEKSVMEDIWTEVGESCRRLRKTEKWGVSYFVL